MSTAQVPCPRLMPPLLNPPRSAAHTHRQAFAQLHKHLLAAAEQPAERSQAPSQAPSPLLLATSAAATLARAALAAAAAAKGGSGPSAAATAELAGACAPLVLTSLPRALGCALASAAPAAKEQPPPAGKLLAAADPSRVLSLATKAAVSLLGLAQQESAAELRRLCHREAVAGCMDALTVALEAAGGGPGLPLAAGEVAAA